MPRWWKCVLTEHGWQLQRSAGRRLTGMDTRRRRRVGDAEGNAVATLPRHCRGYGPRPRPLRGGHHLPSETKLTGRAERRLRELAKIRQLDLEQGIDEAEG